MDTDQEFAKTCGVTHCGCTEHDNNPGLSPDVKGIKNQKCQKLPLRSCCAVGISSPTLAQFTEETNRMKVLMRAHQRRGEALNPHCFTASVTASPRRDTHPSFVLEEAASSPVGPCRAASMGPTLAQQSGMRGAGRRDSERWGGADSEWQLHCLLHSSLGDSFSILDRPFGKALAAVSSDPRPEGYCNVFTRIAPNCGRALRSSPGERGTSEAWTQGRAESFV